MVFHSSARSCLLAVLLAHPAWWFGKESAPLRAADAGDVSDKIDGKWQEFWFFGVNVEVYPCSGGCSSDPDSEGLGDNSPPWTFKSSTSCLLLEIIEGYGGGQSVFEVFNNEVSLGNTTDVPLEQGSTTCYANPTECYFDSAVGKGKFTLQKDVQHSILIIPRREDYPGGTDGAWFRLKSVACDGGGGPTCAKARSVCAPSTKCCRGLVCRKSQAAPSSQPRCLACAKARQYCSKNADCCSKKCLKRTKKCAA